MTRLKNVADGDVAFLASENTLKPSTAKDQLLPLVTTVDSGAAEVVRRQEQGRAYLKLGP